MTIGRRILLAYAVPIAFTIATGGILSMRVRALNETVRALATDSLRGTDAVGRLAGIAKDMRGGIRSHITSANADGKVKAEKDLAELDRAASKQLGVYRATISDARDRELFGVVPTALNRLRHTADAIVPLSRQGKADEAMAAFRSQTMPAYTEAQKAIEKLAEFKKSDGDARANAAEASVTSARLWVWTAVALSLASCGLIGWRLSRHISAVLSSAVRNLRSISTELASTTTQIAESSQQLANDTSEHSSSLVETSASSVEIRGMAARNAENSQLATRDVEEIARGLDAANRALQTMLSAMEAIDASNRNVSRIIGAIDGIAFQTNMLALNAAVEAARAGQSGLGFGVVADEVRTLARRVADAARDSSSIVEDLLGKSSAGKKQLQEIAISIEGVDRRAGRVKTLIHDVQVQSEEQAHGVAQVSTAVVYMEQVLARTATMADQSASASRNLSSQSRVLRGIVESLSGLVEADVTEKRAR